jgi:hypothetical protein
MGRGGFKGVEARASGDVKSAVNSAVKTEDGARRKKQKV